MAALFLTALLGTAAVLMLRQLRPELAPLAAMAAGACLLLAVIGDAAGVFDAVRELSGKFGVDGSFLRTVWKILTLAYLTQFGAQLCRDAGQGAIAVKLELGGRVLIVSLTLPQLVTLAETGAALLRGL